MRLDRRVEQVSKILDGVTFKKNKKKLRHSDHTPEYLAYHKDEPGAIYCGNCGFIMETE